MKQKNSMVFKVIIVLTFLFIIMCLLSGLQGGPMQFIESVAFLVIVGGAIYFTIKIAKSALSRAKQVSRNIDKKINKKDIKSELQDEIIYFVSQHPDYVLVSVRYASPCRIQLKTENSTYYFDIDENRYANPKALEPYELIFVEIALEFDGEVRKRIEEIGGTEVITEIWIQSRESIEKQNVKKDEAFQKKVWY